MSAIVDAARSCIGARFRPQGRDPAYGLDCVGLAGVAFGRDVLPRDYALRGGDARRIQAQVEGFGLRRVDEAAAADLLLLRTGAAQYHLAVMTESGFVHADARLRRVVETPGVPPWPVIGIWREG
jgi:hypothetical protein